MSKDHAMTTDTVANPPLLVSTRADGVLTLTLNRPQRFNPLSSDMIAALLAELSVVEADADIRVVVLAAEGRGFCAGHDLKEMRAHAGNKEWTRRLFDDCS